MILLRSLRLLLLLLLLPLAGVQAAGLQVSPILLEFGAADTAQILWLANSGSTPLRAQVRVQRWSQSAGEESLEPSRDLVASPPLLEIAPGERQMVRLVRLDSTPPDQEQSYRLLIDELPPGPDAATAPGLQFLLQYSLPVFVSTAASPALPDVGQGPVLEAELLAVQGQATLLQVRNTGKSRARLSDLLLENPDGSSNVLASGLLGYVLAGQQMQWPVELPGNALGATLKVMLNDEQEARTLLTLRENR